MRDRNVRRGRVWLKASQVTMPRVVLTADQEEAAAKAAGSDLQYLFDRQSVTRANQLLFFHHGVTTVEKFACFSKDRADLEGVLKEHWGLDQDADISARVQVAAITCAHTNAQKRNEKVAEADAECDLQDRAKPLVPGEWAAMRSALERRHGPIDDRVMPAKEYAERKLAEVEANEYGAEPMTEVVTKEEVEPDSVVPIWDSKGRISMKRGSTKIEEPGNAEALRRRLTVLRNVMVLLSLKHTNRPELQGNWTSVIEDYKDYVLGDYVWGLHAKDSQGNTIASPPWSLVLSYELAIRREAAKLVNQEGKTLTASLKQAWKDPTVKERHFTTPLALYSKRPAPASSSAAPSAKRGDFASQRAKGRGKGRAGGKTGPSGGTCASHTPDGDLICYRLNTAGEKCRSKKCKYKHFCGLCFSDQHSMPQCSAQKRQDPPKDTAGAGP